MVTWLNIGHAVRKLRVGDGNFARQSYVGGLMIVDVHCRMLGPEDLELVGEDWGLLE